MKPSPGKDRRLVLPILYKARQLPKVSTRAPHGPGVLSVVTGYGKWETPGTADPALLARLVQRGYAHDAIGKYFGVTRKDIYDALQGLAGPGKPLQLEKLDGDVPYDHRHNFWIRRKLRLGYSVEEIAEYAQVPMEAVRELAEGITPRRMPNNFARDEAHAERNREIKRLWAKGMPVKEITERMGVHQVAVSKAINNPNSDIVDPFFSREHMAARAQAKVRRTVARYETMMPPPIPAWPLPGKTDRAVLKVLIAKGYRLSVIARYFGVSRERIRQLRERLAAA